MSGHPDLFRSVRDLGRIPVGCSCPSGISEGCSPGWLPAWLPSDGLADRFARRRPSASQAGHIPSCDGSYACYALLPVAAACGWSLLLLSRLLSALPPSLLARWRERMLPLMVRRNRFVLLSGTPVQHPAGRHHEGGRVHRQGGDHTWLDSEIAALGQGMLVGPLTLRTQQDEPDAQDRVPGAEPNEGRFGEIGQLSIC